MIIIDKWFSDFWVWNNISLLADRIDKTYPLVICLTVYGTEEKEEKERLIDREVDRDSWRQILTVGFSCCFSSLGKQTKKNQHAHPITEDNVD
jgi:hypothetical protein